MGILKLENFLLKEVVEELNDIGLVELYNVIKKVGLEEDLLLLLEENEEKASYLRRYRKLTTDPRLTMGELEIGDIILIASKVLEGFEPNLYSIITDLLTEEPILRFENGDIMFMIQGTIYVTNNDKFEVMIEDKEDLDAYIKNYHKCGYKLYNKGGEQIKIWW